MSGRTDSRGTSPPAVDIRGLSKRFGPVQALDSVSLALPPGSFHALLGENGAGKSTFAKCLMGYHHSDSGHIRVDGRVHRIDNPRQAHALGLGMVYQHFSLVPHMTVTENLIAARADNPFVFNWKREKRGLDEFLAKMPFGIDLSTRAAGLAAGEKQKVEILKQLFLNHRCLLLDEPTSVLTPSEANELFGLLRQMTDAGELSVLLITHKFREVFAFATEVTVLRRGRLVGHGRTDEFEPKYLAQIMVGDERLVAPVPRVAHDYGDVRLRLDDLYVNNDKGFPAVRGVSLAARAGEFVGIAGVSGNGQRELVEVLAGQRMPTRGRVLLHGEPYSATRAEMRRHKLYCLPEEPLRNACAATLSVAENLALRDFDRPPEAVGGWLLNLEAIRRKANNLIERYGIHTPSPETPVTHLSGGNIQRTVLARELSHDIEILVASNPCAGLDVGAISEIHAQIVGARNRQAAVLLVSEDLDELIALADRILVIFEGAIVYEVQANEFDAPTIGRHMAGHHEGTHPTPS